MGKVASLAAACMCLGGSALAAVGIGDPPRHPYHCAPQMRPCGKQFVIGVGRDYTGRAAIAAMQINGGDSSAVFPDRPDSWAVTGPAPPPNGEPIAGTLWGHLGEPPRGYATEVAGSLRADVARVRVRYRKGGEHRSTPATVARVRGRLLRRLGEQQPFGFYDLLLKGCVDLDTITVRAYDSAGNLLAQQQDESPLGDSCRG